MPLHWQTSISPSMEPVMARLATASTVMLEAVQAAMAASMTALLQDLQHATPRGSGPQVGTRLADAWSLTSDGFRFRITNTEGNKLFYVLKGNDYPRSGGGGDGYIYPTRSSRLRFEIDGQVIYARRVKASPPNEFVKPVVDAWRVGSKALFKTTFRRTAHWLARG
jgi:hypothetical protein